MKILKLMILITFFLHAMTACAPGIEKENLVGTWKGSRNGSEMIVTFKENLKCEIVLTQNHKESIRLKGIYTVDFSKRPIPLTITRIARLNHSLNAIIRFHGGKSLTISQFSKRWRLRPIAFEDASKMILTKEPT